MARLRSDDVRRMRAAAQGLFVGDPAPDAPGRARTVLAAVRRASALQAQDTRASRLQVRARSAGLTAADTDAAWAGSGAGAPEVVRTWLMRGTLHAVDARDVRWLTALLGPRIADASRGRRQRLGLDDELCARGLVALDHVLAGHVLERDALVARLAERGVVLDPRGQAPAHLLLYAAARGLVCRGPQAAGDAATYALTDEWLAGVADAGFTGDEALAELAVRHATAYGPVTAADLARWSGLPLGRARRAQAAAGARLAEVAGLDGTLITAADAQEPPAAVGEVRLTGHFDPYLLGYRDRDAILPPVRAHRVATGGGLLLPCVLRDGAVVGTWRHHRRGGLDITVETFSGARPRALTPGIDAEVADIARFLGVPAVWHWSAAGA